MILIEPQTLDQPTNGLNDQDEQPASHHGVPRCFFEPALEPRCQPPASGMIGTCSRLVLWFSSDGIVTGCRRTQGTAS